jgi:hypothetical protein
VESVDFPWRQLGALLVDEQLLTETELEQALTEQRRTGRLLGQIIVDNGYVSAFSLARVLSRQHGVDVRPATEPEPQPATQPPESGAGAVPETAWRPLGRLLVERGFLTQAELDDALAEQRDGNGRLGEILVARGVLTGPTLARVLAEQHGVDLGHLTGLGSELETVLEPAKPEEPTYQVCEVVFRQGFQTRTGLFDSTNFLEAADFAIEHVQEHEPEALEIERLDRGERETVWTYSAGRAAAANAERKELVDTFGFDPIRWGSKR